MSALQPTMQLSDAQMQALYQHFNSMVAMQTVRPGFTFTKPTGGGTTAWQIPSAGILKGIRLNITGSVAGNLSAPNAFGLCSIVRRIRLQPNNANIVMDFSGQGYHWLLRDNMDEYANPENSVAPGHGGRDPVVPSTFDISMYIPVMINQREPVGLWMLQNTQAILTLFIDWEADATVATGATVTATAVPSLELFTIPDDYGDGSMYKPIFSRIHTVLEEQESVGATGQYTKVVSRLGTFLQIYHGTNHGVYGSDNFSEARLRINQANFPHDVFPDMFDYKYARNHPSPFQRRPPGTIQYDLMEQTGLHSYSNQRDLLNSVPLTDVASVITVLSTASVPFTLYTIRRSVYIAA